MRELEIGTSYFQVVNTKLLCSSYSEIAGYNFYDPTPEPFQPYKLKAVKLMDIKYCYFTIILMLFLKK